MSQTLLELLQTSLLYEYFSAKNLEQFLYKYALLKILFLFCVLIMIIVKTYGFVASSLLNVYVYNATFLRPLNIINSQL